MADFFITLAVLFLLGLGAYWLGLKTALPSVTLLILLGVGIGPAGLDLFAEHRAQWFPVIANTALVMLGFLMGGALTLNLLRQQGLRILCFSIGVVLGTFGVVFVGMLLLGQPFAVAILLAGIATATDPAATASVLLEERRQHSEMGKTLSGIVALDDVWGLLLFSFCLVLATGSSAANGHSIMVAGVTEIFGAIALGVALGLPMAYLTGRICAGEPTLVEALGLVFLCAGLAFKFEVSHLLAAIVMGATVANLAKHHTRPFHAIEGIEWPFLVLFFILAGASLEMHALAVGGALTVIFVLLRIAGKVTGGLVTGWLFKEATPSGAWMGFALLPQAGVAVALALTASQMLPELGELLLTVTLAATVVFELIGPVTTRMALRRYPQPRQH